MLYDTVTTLFIFVFLRQQMEILQEDIVNLIQENYASLWDVDSFKDHIIINLRDQREDYRPLIGRSGRRYPNVSAGISRIGRQNYYSRSETAPGILVLNWVRQ